MKTGKLARSLGGVALLGLVGAGVVRADTLTIKKAFADSQADWDASGTQGVNGWTYGFYDAVDVATDAGTFNAFDNGTHWNGSQWDHSLPSPDNTPWTTIGSADGHPNATNNGGEFYAIRRYTVPGTVAANSNVAVDWFTRKTNLNNDGVSGVVLVNGVRVDKATIGGDDGVGVTRSVNVQVSPGDIIDLALSPEGLANRSDGSDGSAFGMKLATTQTWTGLSRIADSIGDWSSTGTQGENGWSYGYYNTTVDPGHDVASFIEFDSSVWSGTAWDLEPTASGPWTFIAQEDAHPNGANSAPNEDHWATRRYEVQPGEAGDLVVEWNLAAQNPNGTGTTVKILVNGVEVDSSTIAGNDATGVNLAVEVAGVQVGDFIDISLTPEGLGGDLSDGSDGSTFSANIYLIPEPGVSVLAAFAGLMVFMRRRR